MLNLLPHAQGARPDASGRMVAPKWPLGSKERSYAGGGSKLRITWEIKAADG